MESNGHGNQIRNYDSIIETGLRDPNGNLVGNKSWGARGWSSIDNTLLKPIFCYEEDTGHLIDSKNDTLLDNPCDNINTIPVTDTQDAITVNVGEL